jgi:hypothetical protein
MTMKKTIESLVKKTQKHIEDAIRKFDFDGYFDKKPYKKIRNRLAKKYAKDFIDMLWEQGEDLGEEYIEHECNYYLDDNIWTGGAWEEGAEDFIQNEIENELSK